MKNMSNVFSIEINIQRNYFFNTYFYHLGIKNFWSHFQYYDQYRNNEKYVQLSQCIKIKGYKKPCTYVWLYFTDLTRAYIYQSQTRWRVPFLKFSSTPLFWCRLVLKKLLHDLIYIQKIMILSCQFRFFIINSLH